MSLVVRSQGVDGSFNNQLNSTNARGINHDLHLGRCTGRSFCDNVEVILVLVSPCYIERRGGSLTSSSSTSYSSSSMSSFSCG